ncbi:hypothetical protein HK405_002442 [Cladochytrium tenue]|nr:hypothetical protein HK405_002442 [Cladochytrium tenue]
MDKPAAAEPLCERLEFSGGAFTDAKVILHTKVPKDAIVVQMQKNDAQDEWLPIQKRIIEMVGFRDYSLLLRNCEYVGNYVYDSRWHSEQVTQGHRSDRLIGVIAKKVTEAARKSVNVFPDIVQLKDFEVDRLDSSLMEIYLAATRQQRNEIGRARVSPTSTYKSRLINVLFGKAVVSATKEITFYYGHFDGGTARNIQFCIIDTAGFCDTNLSNDEIMRITGYRLKNTIKCIDQSEAFVSQLFQESNVTVFGSRERGTFRNLLTVGFPDMALYEPAVFDAMEPGIQQSYDKLVTAVVILKSEDMRAQIPQDYECGGRGWSRGVTTRTGPSNINARVRAA